MAVRPWIVKPHDALQKLEPDLWAVESDIKTGGAIRRRMGIVKLPDGGIAFLNAVPLRDEAMREIEAWGTPGILVVPTGYHTLDIAPFKARYPAMRVLAESPRVATRVKVDGGWDAFPSSDRIRAIRLRGMKGEAVFRVGGSLVIPGDAMMNLPHLPGFEGFIWRLLGSTGGPRVTTIAKTFLVSDRKALREHMLELAAQPGLERLVPCHGAIVETDAPGVLRQIAETL